MYEWATMQTTAREGNVLCAFSEGNMISNNKLFVCLSEDLLSDDKHQEGSSDRQLTLQVDFWTDVRLFDQQQAVLWLRQRCNLYHEFLLYSTLDSWVHSALFGLERQMITLKQANMSHLLDTFGLSTIILNRQHSMIPSKDERKK